MHPRLALLAAALLLPLSGCLGVDNMLDLKKSLGAYEEPVEPPILAPLVKAAVSMPVAKVGDRILFSAAGTTDPQGLPLAYTWSFGDGSLAYERDAEHAYTRAGAFVASVSVANAGGVADVALVRVQVSAVDAVPIAEARAAPGASWVGRTVQFSSGGSYDPEGSPIRTLWDFGDGASSLLAEPTHAFSTPGRKTVTLDVLDAAAQATRTTVIVPVSWSDNRSGVLDATMSRVEARAPILETPHTLRAVVTFEGAPTNDLRLEIRDAAGRLVEVTSEGGTRLPGEARVVLELVEPTGAFGEWTVSVVRHSGVRVPFTLGITVLHA